MFQGKIFKRIMDAVKAKMREAQAEYDQGVTDLNAKLENDISELEDRIVNEFLNKIL